MFISLFTASLVERLSLASVLVAVIWLLTWWAL
jgi:hypothetical protein